MSVPILTAVGDARWEAELTAGLTHGADGVEVVRRCVDLADLLAASAAGLARAVVLSGDLRHLDRDALSRLQAARVAVVGLVAPGDEPAEQRLRQLGVLRVVPADATSTEVSAAVLAAVAQLGEPVAAGAGLDWSGPALPDRELMSELTGGGPPDRAPALAKGRIVAVWGPAGSPGRTTVAVNLAAELAALGLPTLLVDADTYGASVGQLLGLLDEAPGLAAACRLANAGGLDAARLGELSLEVRPGLRALTGITRPQRWVELRAPAVTAVLDVARSRAALTVVDCGFCLEQDEELSYDTAAPRRNGATLAALAAADLVIGVAGAGPVGLARYVRALPDCAAVSAVPPLTVVNRLRRTSVGPGDPRREVGRALHRFAGIDEVFTVPEDSAAVDAAVVAGRTLLESAPKSPARRALVDIARQLSGEPVPRHRRGTGVRHEVRR